MDVDITIPAQSVTIPSQDVTATIPAAEIVYSNSWTGQTSNLSDQFFTGSEPGLYRVSAVAYCASNPTPGAATVSVSCSVNDGNSNQLIAFGASADASDNRSSSTEINTTALGIVGLSGSAQSQLTVTASISDPSHILNHYDVYVTVEQVI